MTAVNLKARSRHSQGYSKFTQRCLSAWYILCVFYLLNITSNTMQFVQDGETFVRILDSVLHSFILLPITFMVFYRGYRSVSYDNTMFKVYLYSELPILAFYCYHLKYQSLCYNGFDRLMVKYNQQKWITFGFIIAETFVLFLSIWQRFACVLMAINWRTRDTY